MHNPFVKRRGHSGGLRNAGRAALAAIAVILSVQYARAQTYPNGLSADSVNPDADAVMLKSLRKRLNSVRRDEKRPTVAVVLSGGGAKGAAQVGALKYLEEQDIPIALICGTSIGSLVGGLYAVGYRSEDLKELFTSQNWGVTLTDRIDPQYIPYNEKVYSDKFLVNIPVHIRDKHLILPPTYSV